MKILLINQFCGHGSTGRICTDLYNIAKKNGDDCYIAYGRYRYPADINTYKIGTNWNVYRHVFESRFLDNDGFSSKYSTKKFIKFIENYNPDVIHIHNLHGYYINSRIRMEFLKKNNKKIIWTFHDCWPFSPRSAYIDFGEDGKLPTVQSIKESNKQYPRALFSLHDNYSRKKKIFTGLENLTIVTPSIWLRNMVENSFFKEYKCLTIHNGIDLESFKPREMPLEIVTKYNISDKKIILAVANVWDERKGLKFLNELSNKLNETYKLVVIGKLVNGSEKISNRIIHIERTDSIEILSYWYSKADYFVNPTLYDNFPTTNLEALACGTPVITFNTGGSGESIDTLSGEVLSDKSSESLFKAITSGKSFKKEDCIRRSKLFEKEKQFQEYINLYHGDEK